MLFYYNLICFTYILHIFYIYFTYILHIFYTFNKQMFLCNIILFTLFTLFTLFFHTSYALKNGLLKCKFDSKNKCTSFRIINQNRIGYEETNKGFALTSWMKDSLSKKTLKPGFILSQKKTYLHKIFHRNVIKDQDDEIWINILLPDSFTISCTININIYSDFKNYNAKKCDVYDFIRINCEIPKDFVEYSIY